MTDQPSEPQGPDLARGVPLADLQDDRPLVGHFQGESVLLVRRGKETFAIGATCTHYGGPLGDGMLVGDTVRCPWHHACFSLRTGEALRTPALNPVKAYDVTEREGSVFVTGVRAAQAPRRMKAASKEIPPSVGVVGAGAAGNAVAEELRKLG